MTTRVQYEVSLGEATQRYELETEEGDAEAAVAAFSLLFRELQSVLQGNATPTDLSMPDLPQH